MAEIIKFPGPKKENQNNNPEGGFRHSEKNAIAMLSSERVKFLLEIRKSNPANRNSETYKNALENLRGMSNVEIAEMLSSMLESEIKRKPTYFTAAFNILLERGN